MRILNWNNCGKIAVAVAAFFFVVSVSLKGDDEKKTTKDEKKLTIRAKSQSIQLTKGKTDVEKYVPGQVYAVGLINKSSTYTCIGIKTGTTNWVLLPQPIGRTCDLASCQACLDAGRYAPILNVSCTDSPFDLYLMLRDKVGQVYQAGPARINPSCDYLGEVLCLDLP